MSDQNTILPDILTDETKIFILSAEASMYFETLLVNQILLACLILTYKVFNIFDISYYKFYKCKLNYWMTLEQIE